MKEKPLIIDTTQIVSFPERRKKSFEKEERIDKINNCPHKTTHKNYTQSQVLRTVLITRLRKS
jgi:hypothetical protein